MNKLLPEARAIVAKAYLEGTAIWRGIMGGQFDNGRLVQDALKDLINAEEGYARLPEELPPETPLNAIDDE